jgi:uncharacterized phiE125 gp8 family phage protein
VPVRLITAATEELVSLPEAKAHLRLEHDLDDRAVGDLITSATRYLEEVCWRGFCLQTWERTESRFPADVCFSFERQGLELPMGNLVSVTSLKYIDPDGVERTAVQGTDYVVDTDNVPGRVRLAYGLSWPSVRSQWDAVRCRYVVGWSAANVPRPLKQAALMLVSQMYEHRTPEVTGTIVSAVQFAVNALIAPYRLVRF